MLVENQWVEFKWNILNQKGRQWYIDKGYELDEKSPILKVKAEDLMRSSGKKVNVRCDYCGGIVKKRYVNYYDTMKKHKKYACNNCKMLRVSEETYNKRAKKFIDEFNDICIKNDYTPITNISDFTDARMKVYFGCKKHGIQSSYLSNMRAGQLCPQCGYEITGLKLRKDSETVINIIESKNGNKLLNPDEYVSAGNNNLKVLCGKCKKNTFTTSLSNYKYSYGLCESCVNNIQSEHMRLDKDELIKRIESKNNNRILNPDEYVNTNEKNIKILCGSCNRIFITSFSIYNQNIPGKCPDCNERSYGEYLISILLDKYKINYTRQEHFNGDCRDIYPLPFDFYLPDYNMCIEFDGQGHYEPIWSEESFLRTILHDGMKNNYCRWNNIKLLRIPYWESNNMEDILIKELNLTPKAKKIIYIPTAQRKQNKTA